MKQLAILCCLLGLLLTSAPRLLAGWGAPLPEGMAPVLAIPKMTQPPTIDGAIDPAEWREATAVSGVGGAFDNLLYARPTTYFLGWDADHLYMAIRVWVKPGYKPYARGRAAHSAIVYEDGAEFNFQPMGKNVPPGRTSSSFKFLLNTLGYDGDLMRIAVGQQFKNWLPNFKSASRLTAPGTAPLNGHWLEIEWAASTQDFELAGPNRAGDQWKLMLGFDHMYSGWSQGRIPATTSYFDPGGYPLATLVENTPAVQVLMEDLPGPLDGVATVKMRAYNPTAQPVTLNLLAQYAEVRKQTVNGKEVQDSTDLLKKEQPLTIAPGKTAEFVLNEPFPHPVDEKNTGSIYYRVTQGNTELFRYFIYFPPVYPKDAMQPAPPATKAFSLEGAFNPVRSTFNLVADAYYLETPADAARVTYRVLGEGRTTPVATGAVDKAVTFYFRKLIQLPVLTPGKYTIEAMMETKDGKKLGPETVSFVKKDEAKEYAAWWGGKVGSSERVIWPFTPVKRKGNAVSVLGRTYTLNALGLPTELTSQGKPVTAGAARIVAVIDGKETAIPLTGAPKFTEQKDWRTSFTGTAKGAGLVFTVKGWVEQDGLAYLDLTYAPAGSKPVVVDALRIEFPLANTEADCLLCQGAGGNYASRTTMLLPPKKDGTLWTTLDTGKNGSGMTVGSFYPEVWIGNEQRGFMWYADNDKGWVPDDAVPAHEVARHGDVVILRNNLIGKPFTLEAPRTVSFTYMASPFKTMPKGWRMAIYSSDGTFDGINKKRKDPKTGDLIDGWAWLTPPSRDPNEWSALWAEYKKIADTKIRDVQWRDPWSSRNGYGSTVHTSLPLMGYDWKTPDKNVTDYFGPDWEGDSWNTSEQDYFTWIIDRAFTEGGLRTIYWDIFFVSRFDSIQNGVAYELPDGRFQPGFNGLNIRRFMQRVYSIGVDHGLAPGAQVSHATNCYCLVASPWMDAILDGEYHSITDDSGMDWVDGYPIERMRTMSCTENWGTQISWMNLMNFKDPVKAVHAQRGFAEWPRMFDTWAGLSGNFLSKDVLDWGINEEKTVYTPFWRNGYVVTKDPDILISMWQLPDRILLAVFNYNRKDYKTADLTIDLDSLNLTPTRPWQEFVGVRDFRDAWSQKEPASTLDFYTRKLTVPNLEPHTGRLIGIRKY